MCEQSHAILIKDRAWKSLRAVSGWDFDLEWSGSNGPPLLTSWLGVLLNLGLRVGSRTRRAEAEWVYT